MPVGFPDYYGGLTLPVTVEEGGTGQTSLDAHAVLLGAGTSGVTTLTPGTSGTALLSNGADADPSWGNPTVDVSQITGILSVAHGGTGTDSPALVAGTGISITGTWPDNTITNSSAYASLADPLPVAHGGTGSTSPSLVAGTAISITGTWPNQTVGLASSPTLPNPLFIGDSTNGFIKLQTSSQIAYFEIGASTESGTVIPLHITKMNNAGTFVTIDTSGNIALAGTLTLGSPLAVDQGGTGTSSPSLIGGTGISISGTWPDQTIALATQAAVRLVGHGSNASKTSNIPATTLVTPTTGKYLRLNSFLYLHSGDSNSKTIALRATYTYNGNSFTVNVATVSASSSTNAVGSGSVYFLCDASTAVQYSTSVTGIMTSSSYDYGVAVEEIF